MYLSSIVFSCATVPTCLAIALARRCEPQREPLRFAGAIALAYSACVGYLVALAASNFLARSSTKLLGKRLNGTVHPLSWLFLSPYHVGLRVKLGVQRLVSSEPLYNRVLPGWYIGGWPWDGSELPADSPSVLDCTCELPRTHRSRYLCLPIWDTQAPLLSLIERGVQFAMTERSLGKPVYVHCAHGHGRSALLLIACLLEAGQVGSYEEGLALLQSVRPKVRLNRRQRVALEAWSRGRGGSSRVHALQMHALSSTSSIALAAAAATAGGGGAPTASHLDGEAVAGGGDNGGDNGFKDESTVHLLAEAGPKSSAEQHYVSAPNGLEPRVSGHAAAAAAAAAPSPYMGHGAESLRGGGAPVAAATAAAAVGFDGGGKKLRKLS